MSVSIYIRDHNQTAINLQFGFLCLESEAMDLTNYDV